MDTNGNADPMIRKLGQDEPQQITFYNTKEQKKEMFPNWNANIESFSLYQVPLAPKLFKSKVAPFAVLFKMDTLIQHNKGDNILILPHLIPYHTHLFPPKKSTLQKLGCMS